MAGTGHRGSPIPTSNPTWRGSSSLGATRIGFASPYLGEINEQAMRFLGDAGIETVHCHDIGRALGNYGQGELQPQEVFTLGCMADHPEAQAIVLSCTDMRSVEVVDALEAELGKPVISSNQAMVYALMRAMNRPPPATGCGQLLTQVTPI